MNTVVLRTVANLLLLAAVSNSGVLVALLLVLLLTVDDQLLHVADLSLLDEQDGPVG